MRRASLFLRLLPLSSQFGSQDTTASRRKYYQVLLRFPRSFGPCGNGHACFIAAFNLKKMLSLICTVRLDSDSARIFTLSSLLPLAHLGSTSEATMAEFLDATPPGHSLLIESVGVDGVCINIEAWQELCQRWPHIRFWLLIVTPRV